MTKKLHHSLVILFFGICTSLPAFAETCPKNNLDAYLAHEEPRFKKAIQKLSLNEILKSGIRLCDGTILFKDWRYLGKVKNLNKGQHVFLFKKGNLIEAITWVDPDGTLLPIPTCSNCSQESREEGQYTISGDIYTWEHVQPEGDEGGHIVIINYPPADWIHSVAQKNK